MRNQEIKFKNNSDRYSIFIGENTIKLLSKKIKTICPQTKKIALIIDNNLPNKLKFKIKKSIKNYEILDLPFNASEKNKSISQVNYYVNSLLVKNFISLIIACLRISANPQIISLFGSVNKKFVSIITSLG